MAVAAEACATRPRTSPGSRPTVGVRSDGVPLSIGSMDTGVSQALTRVLATRRSTREFASLSLRELAPVLLRSARVTDIPTGDRTSSRYRSHLPSPGALHPHEVWIAAHGVSDLPDGLWRFDPFTCTLDLLDASGPSIERAVSRVGIAGGFPSRAPATLFLVADFSAIDREYFAGATLVWRDAGVLGLALQLCAEDLGLASCIVGTSGAIVKLGADSTIQDTLAVAIGGKGSRNSSASAPRTLAR